MLRYRLGKPKPKPKSLPTGPEGRVLYVIGDVHGCHDALKNLLGAIDTDIKLTNTDDFAVAFLGDLIDRGPDSKAVVDLVLKISQNAHDNAKIVLLAGNHEDALIRVLDGDETMASNWIRFGGDSTLRSYGVDREDFDHMGPSDLISLVRRTVPADHVELLRQAHDMAIFGDFILVHAGVDPNLALEEQARSALLWIREPFLSSREPLPTPYCVIHGHTIVDTVQHHGHRIAVDTGSYESGHMSCLRIENRDVRAYTTETGMSGFDPIAAHHF